ncbi:MAG: iron-containing alcohol dehydrogenase [Clostridia bacterium]|nr:iron-containing alcohol dehydrogenase [Clostridia bacterium]
MNTIRFHMPVEVIRREGALQEVGTRAAAFGKRCLILTGASSAQQNRALEDALTSLKAAGVEATVFPGISPNPTIAECRAAADAAEAAGAHSLLAIGGGSVMDAAKAVAWMSKHFIVDPEALFRGELKRDPMPLMVCGTTAGTGSEVSAVAVITDDHGKKRSVKSPRCYARIAFCDPRYTDTMPRSVTVSTALDALCHAVEGYLNPTCDALSSLFAEQALPLLTDGLAELCDTELPDKDGRDRLFDGALLAGAVLNTCGTAFPHPMGYVLTEDHGIPHGQACAVFLPALLDCAREAVPERYERMLGFCGGEERLRHILQTLTDVEVTMTDEQLAVYDRRFSSLPHYARVPGGFDGEQASALLRTLFAK